MFKLPFLNKSKSGKIKPTVLLIIDGFGIAPDSDGNAITKTETPSFDYYQTNYPYGSLIAAGESVGLPANEAGNSEVGHLTIGAGRTVDQSLVHINKSIEDETFFQNTALLSALEHTVKNNSKLHIVGLISSGSVHSDLGHFYALLDMCMREKVRSACIHLFTDGRDASPTNGINVITEVEEKLKEMPVGEICTVSGRYYAMDRDARWDRTKLMYDALVLGRGPQAPSAIQAVKDSYAKGITDEFIMPTVITNDKPGLVDDNDAFIFFNFRIDRPRQLTMAFVLPDFENMKQIEFGYVPHNIKLDKTKSEGPTFTREKRPGNVYFVTMTEYQKNLPVSAIAYPPPKIVDSLAEVYSKLGIKQMHLAESEKERMVTFYIDGLKEDRFSGEDVVIVPSPQVATYDKKPEMNVMGVVNEFKKAISTDEYHFFCMNIASPDMVAHSGNIEATVKALGHVDKAVKSIVEETLTRDGTVLITADHGNCEEMLTFDKSSFYFTTSEGKVNTEHSNNPVPVYIIGNKHKIVIVDGVVQSGVKYNINGSLSDVAPTILALAGIKKPDAMTGISLIGGEAGNGETGTRY